MKLGGNDSKPFANLRLKASRDSACPQQHTANCPWNQGALSRSCFVRQTDSTTLGADLVHCVLTGEDRRADDDHRKWPRLVGESSQLPSLAYKLRPAQR